VLHTHTYRGTHTLRCVVTEDCRRTTTNSNSAGPLRRHTFRLLLPQFIHVLADVTGRTVPAVGSAFQELDWDISSQQRTPFRPLPHSGPRTYHYQPPRFAAVGFCCFCCGSITVLRSKPPLPSPGSTCLNTITRLLTDWWYALHCRYPHLGSLPTTPAFYAGLDLFHGGDNGLDAHPPAPYAYGPWTLVGGAPAKRPPCSTPEPPRTHPIPLFTTCRFTPFPVGDCWTHGRTARP